MKIGVVGLGAVGGTVYSALKFYHNDVLGYDKFKPSDPFDEVAKADFLFLALPTNIKENRLDCSLLAEALEDLEKRNYSGIVVIKSTITVDFVKELGKYNLRIVNMPEFLHENARMQDFLRPKIIVISGNEEDAKIVMDKVFNWVEKQIPVFYVDYLTAAMTKLVMNAFAATKISFSNEVGRMCTRYKIDPKLVMKMVVAEGRASPEYTDPTKGPFAGKCLPKDLEEINSCLESNVLFKAVREVNEVVKKEWNEKQKRFAFGNETSEKKQKNASQT
jgi:UDPglucose 6-dehydrogenase